MLTIQSFTIRHRNRTLYDCQLSVATCQERTTPFTTLIIGENGSGKSYLLAQIADFFRHLSVNNVNERLPAHVSTLPRYDSIRVVYVLNGVRYDITKEGNKYHVTIDEGIAHISDVKLPGSILALSFMVNDKFQFENAELGTYQYLGVRAASNAAYTSSIQKKLLGYLLAISNNQEKSHSAAEVLKFIGLRAKVRIAYPLLRKTLFTRPPLRVHLESRLKRQLKQKRYLTKNRVSVIHEKIAEFPVLLTAIRNTSDIKDGKVSFVLDLEAIDGGKKDIVSALEILEDLSLVGAPEIGFEKNTEFQFEHTSSGEKHIVFSMLGLISRLDDNAIVLIDEPELSLHPRWQMQYVSLLKKICANQPGAHCILASHSHFFVSDLDPLTSSLVTVQASQNESLHDRECSLIPYDTYAWSAENILYTVFGMRTTRNYYFEADVARLLEIISNRAKEERAGEASELVTKLEQVSLGRGDPLQEVLRQAGAHIRGRDDQAG